jgi:hypothetical protein
VSDNSEWKKTRDEARDFLSLPVYYSLTAIYYVKGF